MCRPGDVKEHETLSERLWTWMGTKCVWCGNSYDYHQHRCGALYCSECFLCKQDAHFLAMLRRLEHDKAEGARLALDNALWAKRLEELKDDIGCRRRHHGTGPGK